MQSILIKNAMIINEGENFIGSVFIDNGCIQRIEKGYSDLLFEKDPNVIDAKGLLLMPGVIDDHVHFREPGLTHKATIFSESRAAVAGGVTSFMEMPNTVPNANTLDILESKYSLAEKNSLANFSFYLGASNNNLNEIIKIDPRKICGIKVFIGSSTGNMLVNDQSALESIFAESPVPVAVHCEDENRIKENTNRFKKEFGENIPVQYHSKIRDDHACFKSTEFAVQLAKKNNTRLHIMHLSTEKEIKLLDNTIPLSDKRITAEVCVNYLYFNENDYAVLGSRLKMNPSIKTQADQLALLNGLLSNKIDLISTDHAPHLLEEKEKSYFNCPSGAPGIQHSLLAILELYHQKKISLETIVDKMCHTPAECFKIHNRGYIRKGYFADLVLVDMNAPWVVQPSNILHKCGWSIMEGQTFHSKIIKTFVNGNLVYDQGQFNESVHGVRLLFNR